MNLLAKDKEKAEVEKKLNIREHLVLNDRRGNLILFIKIFIDEIKKIKKNNRKSNLIPNKLNEVNSFKQKHSFAKKEKIGNINSILPNYKLKDNPPKIKESVYKLSEESQPKRTMNASDQKDIYNNNRNNNKDAIMEKRDDIQAPSYHNKDLKGRGINSFSLENGHNPHNVISNSKEIISERPFNNSHSSERNIIKQQKDSLLPTSYERSNSIEIDKKNNTITKNSMKIPLNMTNIHSFNINVITQTVSNQVNNFISTLSSPLIQVKAKDYGSSSNLINLNSNNNNINIFNNNLIPIKKKK